MGHVIKADYLSRFQKEVCRWVVQAPDYMKSNPNARPKIYTTHCKAKNFPTVIPVHFSLPPLEGDVSTFYNIGPVTTSFLM